MTDSLDNLIYMSDDCLDKVECAPMHPSAIVDDAWIEDVQNVHDDDDWDDDDDDWDDDEDDDNDDYDDWDDDDDDDDSDDDWDDDDDDWDDDEFED